MRRQLTVSARVSIGQAAAEAAVQPVADAILRMVVPVRMRVRRRAAVVGVGQESSARSGARALRRTRAVAAVGVAVGVSIGVAIGVSIGVAMGMLLWGRAPLAIGLRAV
jgi:hypothetical protein